MIIYPRRGRGTDYVTTTPMILYTSNCNRCGVEAELDNVNQTRFRRPAFLGDDFKVKTIGSYYLCDDCAEKCNLRFLNFIFEMDLDSTIKVCPRCEEPVKSDRRKYCTKRCRNSFGAQRFRDKKAEEKNV